MQTESPVEHPASANGGDAANRVSSGAYAQVAALLHESRQEAPDQLGEF